MSRGIIICLIHSLIRSHQSKRNQGFPDKTDTQTTEGHCNVENELAKWVNSVKIILIFWNKFWRTVSTGCNKTKIRIYFKKNILSTCI